MAKYVCGGMGVAMLVSFPDLQTCLVLRPRKGIRRARVRVLKKRRLKLPVHSKKLVCCFDTHSLVIRSSPKLTHHAHLSLCFVCCFDQCVIVVCAVNPLPTIAINIIMQFLIAMYVKMA